MSSTEETASGSAASFWSHPRAAWYTGAVVAALVVASWMLDGQPYFANLMFHILLFAAILSAWNISGGFGGLISLGHAMYFGVGAYASGILLLRLGLTPWLGIPFGGIIAAALAALIGAPLILRLRTHFFALATVAVAEVTLLLTIAWRGFTGGSDGLQLPVSGGAARFVFETKAPYILVALVLCVLSVGVSAHIRRTKLGYRLIAGREDEKAAESLGIDIFRARLLSYVIGAAIVALAGGVYAQYTLYVDPEFSFGFLISINIALFAIVGGLGTVAGPLIGATLLVPLETLLRSYVGSAISGLDLLVNGLILITVVLFFSGGVMDWINSMIQRDRASSAAGNVPKWVVEDDAERALPDFLFSSGARDVIREPLLQVSALSKRFGAFAAVQGVDLTVERGELVGLIGPNGAGKSTFLKVLCGELSPSSGTKRFAGREITGDGAHEIARAGMGRTFQLVHVFRDMTVEETS